MQVTKENLNLLPEKERDYVNNLLDYDLQEINSFNKGVFTLHWQDYHDEYSPERTDPCPDFYGMYDIRKDGKRVMYIPVTLEELGEYVFFLLEVLKNSLENLEDK